MNEEQGERDKGSTVVHIDSLLMPEDRYDRWPQFGEHKLRRILTHSILFWLAGRAAEARFLGIDVGNVSECGADLSEVRDHICHYADVVGADPMEEAWFTGAFNDFNQQAVSMFEQGTLWDFTDRVAQALVEKQSLTGDEVREISRTIGVASSVAFGSGSITHG